MPMTRDDVIRQLHRLECEQNIVVLFACEAGSRSQGLWHPNSDNDVKFIYVRPTRSYLGLAARDDTIQVSADFTGWDVQKALGLAVKSNAQLVEWLSSRHSYWETPRFVNPLRDELLHSFNPRTVMHQFYGNAAKVWKGMQPNAAGFDMTTKDLTLVLRCLLVVLYMARNDHALPHGGWEFEHLMNSTMAMTDPMHGWMTDIYRMRRNGQPMYHVNAEVCDWINGHMAGCKELAGKAPEHQPNTMALERLCLEMTLDSGRLF